MAAPIATYIRLLDDTGYTGVSPKKIHAQSRIVGSDTVYEKEWQKGRATRVLGVFQSTPAQGSLVQTANDGTSTGLLWAHVPTAITNKHARIRAIYAVSQMLGALSVSAPRIRADRFTFTGTATGAGVAIARNNTPMVTPVLDLRTAVTGLTVTLAGGAIATAACMSQINGSAGWSPTMMGPADLLSPFDVLQQGAEEDEWVDLAPGEGIVMYQDVGGTSGDTRKVNLGIVWDEIDTGP